MKHHILFVLVLMSLLASSSLLYAIPLSDPANRHNFSSNSTSDVQAIDDPFDPTDFDSQVCVYCHTPHSASVNSVLWNRKAPALDGTFQTYANGDPNELAINDNDAVDGAQGLSGYGTNYPNGASRLCLSCHDGATAFNDILVGDFLSMNYWDMNDYVGSGGGNPGLVIDAVAMASAHPISFKYDSAVITRIDLWHSTRDSADFDLIDPAITPLDGQDRMQCTTCHDPHDDNSVSGSPFWRHTDYSGVCDNCHVGGPVPNPGGHGT